jgi:hypothetical protein
MLPQLEPVSLERYERTGGVEIRGKGYGLPCH